MSQQSNTTFYVKETITTALWTGGTFNISNELETDTSIEWTTATSIVIKNDSQLERMTITATWWVATIVLRGLEQWTTEVEDSNLKKQWSDWDYWYMTQLAFDTIDKWEDNTFGGTQTFTDIDFTWTTTSGLKLKNLTTTEMNAVTNVSNWQIIYNTTEWENYQYIWGSWSAISAGSTQANASETVAGKVELPTDAEVTAKTATWWTWATMCPTNAQIGKSVALKVVDTTMDETDHIVFDKAGTDNKMLKSVLRDQLAWSKVLKGTFEMLTDTEAATWTDETRVPNSLQMKASSLINAWVITDLSSLTNQNNDTTVTLTFQPRLIKINFWLQGHTASTSTAIYVWVKWTSVYEWTTLQYVKYDIWWNTTWIRLTWDNWALYTTWTDVNGWFNSKVNSTTNPYAWTWWGNNAEKLVTLTINSVSSTWFVIRLVTAWWDWATNRARASISWEAYA